MNFLRVFAAAAAASVVLSTVSANAADKFSASEITAFLQSEGLVVQQMSGDMLAVAVGEQIILIGVHGPDGDVSFVTYMPGLSIRELGYPFLNKFNNAVKFGRAYVDRDGDIAIQMDRNSAGGVSKENIMSDFQVFLLLVTKFMNDVSTGTVA